MQDNFGGIFLDTALIGPFSGLELAFEIDLASLMDVLLHHIDELFIEDHHPVPFGFLAPFVGPFIEPPFRSGNGKIGYPVAVLHGADFGVTAQITHQDDFVHAA